MEVIYPRCAGIDVDKQSLAGCLFLDRGNGSAPEWQKRKWGTHERAIGELAAWLRQNQVTHVAMESTGVYFALSSALIGRVQVPPALG